MRDRRDIIRAGVKAKVTNMSEIRSMYNEFDEGGRTAYGYPIANQKDEGLDDYFKANKHVAGMAIGGGENGIEGQRRIVHNSYNQYMNDSNAIDGLYKIEASRHLMNEKKYRPTFELSPEQQEWRKGLGKYATDDNAFKQSILSREIVGDKNPGLTFEQASAANRLNKNLQLNSAGILNEFNEGGNLYSGEQSGSNYWNHK